MGLAQQLNFINILEIKKNLLVFSLQIHVLAIIVSKLVRHKIVIRIANHPYSSFFEKYGMIQNIKFSQKIKF